MGYEICIVFVIGIIMVEIEGVIFDFLGNCGEDVWDGELEGVYVFVGVKVIIVCSFDVMEIFIVGVKYDKVLDLFDVCILDIDLV